MNEYPETKTPAFDPHDPDTGRAYRSDVVRDVTDFRPGRGSGEVSQDRIKSLENRLTQLEVTVQVGATFTNSHNATIEEIFKILREAERRIKNIEEHHTSIGGLKPLTPADHAGIK